ncbi:MAG: DUF4143 domain-containing protein, partial [Bacteroidetes bacterium]|nr:DUF4143 domain-containing protein [Bacteroidota bacterium]
SLENLSKSLHTDTNTLIACLDLLEKNFITFAWEKRIFFWDNGIRNAILNNFNPLSKRKDADDLWENFITADEMKKHSWIRPNLQ